jgi:hypothetical protein
VGQHRLRAEEGAGDVEPEDGLPLLVGDVLGPADDREATRVVHQHVDPAPALHHRVYRPPHLRRRRDVALQRERLSPLGSELADKPVYSRGVHVERPDARAFPSEGAGDPEPDSLGGAGDEHDTAVESHPEILPPV